ncbi:MAG: sporulation protein YabP [Oscillospiraceae bacterium]|nr:sporulation protein YabP [Oscillospiraceae bacterium]
MPFESRDLPVTPPHRIHLEERSALSISGVEEVESFDETTISLSTSQGGLTVRGQELHIEKLSLDGGDLKVEGTIDSITYEEQPTKGGFFARLWR